MAKNKKKLEEAELRVVRFELNDVIVASGGNSGCSPYLNDPRCLPNMPNCTAVA